MVLVYAAPKLNSSLVTNVLFVQLEDVEGVLMRIEMKILMEVSGAVFHTLCTLSRH